MPDRIVECIPNFSEARRPEVIEALMQVIQAAAGVALLDRHSDHDHNRTVLTFAGSPEGVEAAAFQLIARAAELIDLDKHTGEHPRIGASDVVPFVPIAGVSMQDCVGMAQRLGKRVGEELGIPVYLYEEAATRPERKNLEDIRRGQYEALKEEIGVKPERLPDFGPAKVGPAGATVIGARHPLIAYNVYLTSDDVRVAQKVAKAIRHSSGGLRYVKGLGMLVDGRAQVSMNLTNYRQTPIARVMELIRSEARRYGVEVHHSELVGLIPQEALTEAAIWHLQLDQFSPEQILERRLEAAWQEQAASLPTAFLDALASSSPAPGGGSASAYSGAAAAALVAMVARLTIGRKKYAAVEERMKTILTQAEALRLDLAAAVERDAAAFNQVMAAFQLPKETTQEQEKRLAAIEEATIQAILVPLQVARQAVEVMDLAVEVAREGNLNAISDGATGAAQAQAALTGAGYNVRINVVSLKERSKGQVWLDEMLELERRAAQAQAQLRQILTERGGMPLA